MPTIPLIFVTLLWAGQFSQSGSGELRLTVTDPAGLPLQSMVALTSEANKVARTLETDGAGRVLAKQLPFGTYRVAVSRDGFAPYSGLIEIQSALPTEYHVSLSLAPVQTQVTVSADDTLVDRRQSGSVNRIGSEMLQNRAAALPGRSLPDLVNTQPGWLLEANGILHPRGSEYQVQYVVDGLPITDNRSPAFAPELDADDVRAMSVLTGGYPAEYGRKLGGVIDVVTAADARRGLHGSIATSAGSFGTLSGAAASQYTWGRNTLGISGNIARTDRYLDPPVEENFTNVGTGTSAAVRFERELTDADRFGILARHGSTSFAVPNERVQQDAGQAQDRASRETSGQVSYQHVFGANVLGDVRGLARDLSATLSSNSASTPIVAGQDRGFRELYVKGTVSVHAGAHELKAGLDGDVAAIREQFAYQITDPARFDPATPRAFSFADRRDDREQAAFVQDRVRLGDWTLSAGLRWDHYRLLVDERAFSPRLGVAWSWPAADLVVRMSYDRAFQTPAIENLLLASSPALDSLNDSVVRLPVRPSIGNFYELGASKRLFTRLRLDVTGFRRDMTNFADDDGLLNTGVSFPIAFRRASVTGTEVKLECPRWGPLSGFVSYANSVGVGDLPITGGLLLGDEAASAITSTGRFPVSQDQRSTVRGRASWRLSPRAWVATAASYGSGLPVEFDGDRDLAIAQYGDRIVGRVDFARGRVKPSFSLDASASLIVHKAGDRRVRIQGDVLNVTNRLDVINFAGLFSGTAIAPPRSAAVRVVMDF